MNEEMKTLYEEIRQECRKNRELAGRMQLQHIEDCSKILQRVGELERKYSYVCEKVREKPASFYDRTAQREERIRKIKERLILSIPNLSYALLFSIGFVAVWMLLRHL